MSPPNIYPRPYQRKKKLTKPPLFIRPADPIPNRLLDLLSTIHFLSRPDQGLSHREAITLVCDIYNRTNEVIREIEDKRYIE